MSNLHKLEGPLREIIRMEPICNITAQNIYNKLKNIALKSKPFFMTNAQILPSGPEIEKITSNLDELLKFPHFIEQCSSDNEKREDYITYAILGAFLDGLDTDKMKDTKANYQKKTIDFFQKNPDMVPPLPTSMGGRRKTNRRKNLRKRTRRSKGRRKQ